jgi:hypothetical protein
MSPTDGDTAGDTLPVRPLNELLARMLTICPAPFYDEAPGSKGVASGQALSRSIEP